MMQFGLELGPSWDEFCWTLVPTSGKKGSQDDVKNMTQESLEKKLQETPGSPPKPRVAPNVFPEEYLNPDILQHCTAGFGRIIALHWALKARWRIFYNYPIATLTI